MKKILPVLAFLFLTFSVSAGGADLSREAFVSAMRKSAGGESWGLLKGFAEHRRRGGEAVRAPIRFSVLFTKQRTVAQIVFRGTEIYRIAQMCVPPFTASVENTPKPTLADFGLRPEDLAMNFIFWKLAGEGKPQTVRGLSCRVLLFESPDSKETVRVSASSDYLFPLRVEWFPGPADKVSGKPFRTLEATDFRKSGELWVLTKLSIFGPGWRTGVTFDDLSAGLSSQGIPKELFVN